MVSVVRYVSTKFDDVPDSEGVVRCDGILS